MIHRIWFKKVAFLAIVFLSISACVFSPALATPAENSPTSIPPAPSNNPSAVAPTSQPSSVPPTPPSDKPSPSLGKNVATSLALSPDGALLAIGTSHGIYGYDFASKKQLWFKPIANNPAALAFSPDGSRLSVGAAYPFGTAVRRLIILSASTGETLFEIKTNGDPQVSWSADGKKFVTSGDCLEIEVRDALTTKLIHTLQGADCNVADPAYINAFWSWDQTRIYAIHGSTMLVWDASTYKPLTSIAPDLLPFSTGLSYAVLPSPTEDLLALENGANVAILDEKTGKILKAFPGPQPDFPVGNIAWSPDGKRLAVDFSYGQMVWEVQTGNQIAYLKDFLTPFFSESTVGRTLAWLPDNHTLLGLFSANGAINAVDLDTGKTVFSIPQPVSP